MTKKLPQHTWIDNTPCVTETTYKNYKIYKTRRYGIERYSILMNGKLKGTFLYLKYAKEEVDKLV